MGNALQRRQESALGEDAQAKAAQQQDEDTRIPPSRQRSHPAASPLPLIP